jgi:hypothetical protein
MKAQRYILKPKTDKLIEIPLIPEELEKTQKQFLEKFNSDFTPKLKEKRINRRK